MNKYIKVALVGIVMAPFVSSCIESDSTESTSECAITSFSISDIKSVIHTLGYDGSDSTYTKTLSGSDVKFNIDQLNGLIYNIDSLPNWVDLTHVIPSVTAYGNVYAQLLGDSVYYNFSSGTDSLDFSNPVGMLVTGYDGQSYKKYTVTINKAITDADSLIWTLADSTLDIEGDFRTVVINDTVQVFQPGCPVDYRSVQVFDGQLVGIDKEGNIKTSHDGLEWTSTALPKISSLLSADPYYLHGYDGLSFVSTSDMVTWKKTGSKDLDRIPTEKISSVYFTSKTNPGQMNLILTGQSDADTTNSVVWYKLSAFLDVVDQNWNCIKFTSENDYALPHFANMSNVFIYNGTVNIIGDGYMYLSYDNGITWKQQTNHLLMPKNFDPLLPTQCVVAQEYIFLIQSGDSNRKGRMWKGYINKLNPDK